MAAGESVLYGRAFTLCSSGTGQFLGAAGGIRKSFGADGTRLLAQLQHVEMSLVAQNWADHTLHQANKNTLCGGMVIEIRWYEYEKCLAFVDQKVCLTAPISKYDSRTLWRLETSFSDGPPGAPVEQNSVVRLRHLTEGMYLCREAGSSGHVMMTLDSEHAGAQWQFEILGYYKNIPLADSKVNGISMRAYFIQYIAEWESESESEGEEGELLNESELMRIRVRLRAKCHICAAQVLMRAHPDGQILSSPLDKRISRFMKMKDVNSDGSLDREEWRAAGGTREDFDLLDFDQSGVLDKAELGKTTVTLTGTFEEQMVVGVESAAPHSSKLCNIRPYDKKQLSVILKSVAITKVAQNMLLAVQQMGSDIQGALKQYSLDIISYWGDMILFVNEKIDPKRSRLLGRQKESAGIPKEAEQLMMAQHGALTLTIDLLKLILTADSEHLADATPSKRAILILFRFIQQCVSGCLINCNILELEKEFLYEHLDTEYQV